MAEKNTSVFLMQWDKGNLPFEIWINTIRKWYQTTMLRAKLQFLYTYRSNLGLRKSKLEKFWSNFLIHNSLSFHLRGVQSESGKPGGVGSDSRMSIIFK